MKLLLIGNGGHCRSVLDSVLSMNIYSTIGIVGKAINESIPKIANVFMAGTDGDLPRLFHEGFTCAVIATGSVGETKIRRKIACNLIKIGFTLPNIIDASATVSPNAKLGKGIFIGKKAVVNTDAVIGNFAIVNSSAIIEHDCVIGDFAHIATGAVLCGGVNIGCDTHIGAGATIIQYKTIGKFCLIGAGASVVKNIGDNIKMYDKTDKICEKRVIEKFMGGGSSVFMPCLPKAAERGLREAA